MICPNPFQQQQQQQQEQPGYHFPMRSSNRNRKLGHSAWEVIFSYRPHSRAWKWIICALLAMMLSFHIRLSTDLRLDKYLNVSPSPSGVISYGPKRTASTLQFNMVCVCYFLHIKVYQPSLVSKSTCYYQNFNKPLPPLNNRPQVVKTHKKRHIWDSKESIIFITARNKLEGDEMEAELKRNENIIGLIQDLDTLSEIGVKGYLNQYADFFRLPSDYIPFLNEYFDLWDKLRICCGKQMSKNWRYELNPSTYGNDTMWEPHPFCGSLDIDQIEKKFTNTTIFKMIDPYDKVRKINRPSTGDEELNGSYCSRYNNAVQKEGLKIGEGMKG